MNQHPSAVGRFPLELAQQIAEQFVKHLAPFCVSSADTLGCAQKEGEQPGVVALQVAGSIRRRRPDVGDIDLVAIPKLEQVSTGLFTTETQRPRDSALAVEFCALTGKLFARGDSIIRGIFGQQRPVTPRQEGALRANERIRAEREGRAPNEWWAQPPIGVDLYLCTAETWATTLLIRTGSAEHNIWLCTHARAIGGKLHADGSGLELPGQYDPQLQRTVNMRRLVPRDEADIFAALLESEEVYGLWQEGGTGIAPELRELVHGRPLWLTKGEK